MSDEAAKEILSTWGNSHIKEWMKCKLIVGFRVALDFYKLVVLGVCSPCLAGCESVSLQDML